MIRYDEHAIFQMDRRGISRDQIEQVLAMPDATEARGSRRSFLRCLPGRRVMLRVVTPASDPEYVITAYFDRTRPCA